MGTNAGTEEHYRKLERLYARAPITRLYAAVLQVRRAEAEVTCPVRDDFFHAATAIHGSVYFKLLDDAAFFAVNSLVEDVLVTTVSFGVYLLRPVSQGRLRAVGRVVHFSRRLAVAEAELFDTEGSTVGRGSGTFMRTRLALAPEVGYS